MNRREKMFEDTRQFTTIPATPGFSLVEPMGRDDLHLTPIVAWVVSVRPPVSLYDDPQVIVTPVTADEPLPAQWAIRDPGGTTRMVDRWYGPNSDAEVCLRPRTDHPSQPRPR